MTPSEISFEYTAASTHTHTRSSPVNLCRGTDFGLVKKTKQRNTRQVVALSHAFVGKCACLSVCALTTRLCVS